MGALLPNSGLIVEVPQAEAAVRHHRDALDVNARGGVPAHITVLYPFLPADRIDATVLADLGALFAGVPSFDVALTHTAWFGDQVLWLAPQDPQPFLTLTGLVHGAYPDFPPFAGLFSDVVPHLTIGHGVHLPEMVLAEQAVQEHLPIHLSARQVTLMTQDEPDGTWTTAARFALGTRADNAGAAEASRTTVAP